MALTISAPTIGGGQMELTGQKRGPFLIHRQVFGSGWAVTHIDTGMKFPWCFETGRKAEAFAKSARHILDWDSIKVNIVEREHRFRSKFIKGPTRAQKKAIYDLAKTHDGLRA